MPWYPLVHQRVAKNAIVERASGRLASVGTKRKSAKAALVTWLLTLRQMPGCTAQTFVFRSRKGANRPISKVQAWRILHEAVTTNELTGKVGTHAMRKTFANRAYHQLNHDLV